MDVARGKFHFSTISINGYFFMLVAVISVPIMAFAILLLFQLQQDNEEALERGSVRDAKSLAVTVERQLQDITTTLRLLANSPELRNGDFQGFYQKSQIALAGSSYFVLLLKEDGEQLLNTRVRYGTNLPKTSDLEALHASLQTDDIYISDIFFGTVSQEWVFNVMLPLPSEVGSQRLVLLITRNAEDMGDPMITEGLPNGWSSAVVDGSGKVVANSGHREGKSGEPFPYEAILSASFGSDHLLVDGILVSYASLHSTTWRAVVWGPLKNARISILENQSPLLVSGGILFVLTGLFVVLVSRKIRAPIEALADQAKKMGSGEAVSYLGTPIKELNAVSVALTNASFDRMQAEERLRVLVSESSHRTKNLLTIVGIMIRHSARTFDVPKDYLKSLTDRLNGLATSVDLLARDEWGGVSIRELLHGQLDKFMDTPGQIEFCGEDFVLKPEVVQALSLAIHELGTNAMKYGALSVSEGRVRIDWRTDSESQPTLLELIWQESNGPEVQEPERKGFGSVIINDHVSASLKSAVTANYYPHGFQWSLIGPLKAFSDDGSDAT